LLEGDILCSYRKEGSFVKDLWGQGEYRTFLEVVKGEMAGRGGRGRGRGRGGRGMMISGVVVEGGL
jgi:hypothetical protein